MPQTVRGFRWLATAIGAMSATLMVVFVVAQQIERLGADSPQLQMAEDASAALAAGSPAASLLHGPAVDVARSLAPFIVVLDASGKPVVSSGVLDASVPVPPPGVLAHVRRDGSSRITWAPRAGVRLAAVVERANGPATGFVVAARSLRQTEDAISTIGRLVAFIWLCGTAGLIALAAVAGLARPGLTTG